MNKTPLKQHFDIERLSFTMQNALQVKERHRNKMANLSIDEKIKIVESLRDRIKPIRELKASIVPPKNH